MSKKKIYVIAGNTYQGAQEVADAFDCTRSAVYRADSRGRLEHIGGKRGPNPMRVLSAGRIYENPKECAEKNNVSESAVYNAIADCKEDTIGMKSNPNYAKEVEEARSACENKKSAGKGI